MSKIVIPQQQCIKLELKENISAVLEERIIVRDVEKLECEDNLIHKIVLNYIIVKKIIRNLNWQEQLLCKLVCTTWRDAVRIIQKEQLAPVDFVLAIDDRSNLKTSIYQTTEPLLILAFANGSGINAVSECNNYCPSPCDPQCVNAHNALDVINQHLISPKDCMLTIKTDHLSYLPSPLSPTFPYALERELPSLPPFIGGIIIPKIPDVKCHVVNVNHLSVRHGAFVSHLETIMSTEIIKGILVFVTDKIFWHGDDLLDVLKDIQPDTKFALGGCVIEDTIYQNSEIANLINSLNTDVDYVSEASTMLAIFTVSKDCDEEAKARNNFQMYSFVLHSHVKTKVAIMNTTKEFADKVPRFKHSIALKLACIGRYRCHDSEHEAFRQFFPNTPIVGCFGDGEFGFSYPKLTESQNSKSKRAKVSHHNFRYTYSTVFVYFGWGETISK